jgi:hypothetical protein
VGVIMPPETMIGLIANYSDSGQPVTW